MINGLHTGIEKSRYYRKQLAPEILSIYLYAVLVNVY